MSIASVLTVTTPAASRLLTTIPTAQAILQVTKAEDVAAMIALLPMVSGEIENFCNRTFAREGVSETFRLWNDPPGRTGRGGCDALQMRRYPIVPPSGLITLTVTENGTALVQDTDFVVDYEDGEIQRLDTNGTPIRWPFGIIVIAYTGGYVLPGTAGRNLPQDIEKAAIKQLSRAWFSRQRDPMQMSHGEPGLGQTTYWVGSSGSGMLPEIADLLDNYRAVTVA